jgi:hypothetical protein
MAEDIARTAHGPGECHDVSRFVGDVHRPPPRKIRAVLPASETQHPVRARQLGREPGVPPAVVQATAGDDHGDGSRRRSCEPPVGCYLLVGEEFDRHAQDNDPAAHPVTRSP